MVTADKLREMALAMHEVTEEPHFEKTSFRVKKKIFATYDDTTNRACLKLSEIDQDLFSLKDRAVVYPVPNKWGRHGWTFAELNTIDESLLADLLKTAYLTVAPAAAARKLKERE